MADPKNVEQILNSLNEAQEFNFSGLRKKAKIISVYDADTVDAIMCIEEKPYKFKIRINGIDTPEIKPLKTIPNRELHVECGIKCREYLKSKILNKIVDVQCYEFDKYGRVLADIYLSKLKTVTNELVNKKYAKKYEGKTKIEWTLEELLYIKNN